MASNEGRPLFEYCDDEEYLINWLDEANAILNDVRMHVDEIKVSTELPPTASSVYLNIRTKEQNCYCVYLYSSGLRIVGHAYDTIEKKPEAENGEEEVGEVFESTYALLDKISPSYVQSFGDQLCKQLLHLQQTQMEFNEEDEEEEAEQKEEKEEQKVEEEKEEEESKVKHIN